MATQRRSIRTTPLVQMIKEVYDTKLRMKEVLETQSDDFEEYGTLTHNKFVDNYNNGYIDGYNDGWHIVFPDDQLEEDDWKDGLRDKVSFTPTVPEYSTGSDIDNLIVMMQDSLRCRLLIKDELFPAWQIDGETYPTEDEFVIYPDLFLSKCQTMYETGYTQGKADGLEQATDYSLGTPIIVHEINTDVVTIYNTAQDPDTVLYYWLNNNILEKQPYTGPITLQYSATVNAAAFKNPTSASPTIGPIASRWCDITNFQAEPFCISLADGEKSGTITVEIGYGANYVGYSGLYYSYDKTTWGYLAPADNDIETKTYNIPINSANNKIYFYDEFNGISKLGHELYYSHSVHFSSNCKVNVSGNPISLWMDRTTDLTTLNWIIPHSMFSRDLKVISCEYLDLSNSGYYEVDYNDMNVFYYPMKSWSQGSTILKQGCDLIRRGASNYYDGYKRTNPYVSLYEGCTSLNYIYCMLEEPDANVTKNWVKGVNKAGESEHELAKKVFIKYPTAQWTIGDSGIPAGWTVIDAQFIYDSSISDPVISQDRNTITITNPNAVGDIYYWTSEDSTPRKYTSAITITDNVTIYARIQDGLHVSNIVSGNYLYHPISITNYHDGHDGFNLITINNSKDGEVYYYIDNDYENPTLYTEPFFVYDECKITAYLLDSVWSIEEYNFSWDGKYTTVYARENQTFSFTFSKLETGNAAFYKNTTFVQSVKEDSTITIYADAGDYIAIKVYRNAVRVNSSGAFDTMGDYLYTDYVNSTVVNAKNLYINKFDRYGAYQYDAKSLFYGCSNLITAPKITVQNVWSGCYINMFYGCTSLTTAPELPATTLAKQCYSSMFEGCTSLVNAPELPATTLATQCYFSMFRGCTSLTYIKCLATDISADYCTSIWLYGVSATGTFVKNASMNDWTTGNDGIPGGWTVEDAA